MAKHTLEDVAIDHSRSFKRQLRKDKKALKKYESRNFDVAINLFNYVEDTPGMTRASLASQACQSPSTGPSRELSACK